MAEPARMPGPVPLAAPFQQPAREPHSRSARRGAVRRATGGIRWWFSSVMGDNAYRRYLDHLARHHPGTAVPTEKQYWRDRYAEMDRNPGARCC